MRFWSIVGQAMVQTALRMGPSTMERSKDRPFFEFRRGREALSLAGDLPLVFPLRVTDNRVFSGFLHVCVLLPPPRPVPSNTANLRIRS